MIPTINIDDRKFDDIRDEAIRMIPRYCPEWTNRNISDPGMTLLSVFSWMTEMTLHRINQIPTKTYLALLDLLGFSFKPPHSARSVVTFRMSPNRVRDVEVREGIKIGSVDAGGEPVVFETENNILVRNIKLDMCVNRDKDNWSDIQVSEEGNVSSFSLFDSENYVIHELYLVSPELNYIAEGHAVQVVFEKEKNPENSSEELINYLNWQYYNGESWESITFFTSYPGHKTKRNTLYFIGPEPIKPCLIDGKEVLALKATLVDYPDEDILKKSNPFDINAVRMKVIYASDGFAPTDLRTFSHGAYNSINTDNVFRIFSENPYYDECVYMSANEIFAVRGINVTITYTFSELNANLNGNALAQFIYEYYNGDKWVKLTNEANGFEDTTLNFTKSGKVAFTVPEDIAEFEIYGEKGYYIRIRIFSENLGKGGNFEIDENTKEWKWKFDDKVQSPLLDRIRIGYDLFEQFFSDVITYSNFKWSHFPQLCEYVKEEERRTFKLFAFDREHLPAVYLGFSRAISPGLFSMYFKVDEVSSAVSDFGGALDGIISDEKSNEDKIIIEWQCWAEDGWKTLKVNDTTNCFESSGFISFTSEGEMVSTEFFGKSSFWLRGIKLNGNFSRIPTVKGILLNTVAVVNQDTYKDEVLASYGDDSIYTPNHRGLLPGIDIVVKEGNVPSKKELEQLGRDGVKEPYFTDDRGDIWVRYKEVASFYNSNSFSRHFVVDYQKSQIMFGDGVRGMSPSKNKYDVRIVKYSVGGGNAGNVAAHKLQYLATSVPFIDGCDNPYPAEGGSDMETLDNLKARASGLLKSLERAVTPEDYEWLSREASPAVGRAMCLRENKKFGEARLIIIPTTDREAGYKLKLSPSRELIKQVRKYLEERKVIGTSVVVTGPAYKSFNLSIEVIFKSNYFDYEAEEKKVEEILREYLHPLYGGAGSGWVRTDVVSVGVITKRLELVESILRVLRVEIYDLNRDMVCDEIVFEEHELPFLADVRVSEKQF